MLYKTKSEIEDIKNKYKNRILSGTATDKDKLEYSRYKIKSDFKKSGILNRLNPKKNLEVRRVFRKKHVDRILAGTANRSTKLQSIQSLSDRKVNELKERHAYKHGSHES